MPVSSTGQGDISNAENFQDDDGDDDIPAPASVLNIPRPGHDDDEPVQDNDSGFEDSPGRTPGQIGRPSAKVKSGAEMLANAMGVIGIAFCGEDAEPKKHHRESMQEGFEDYMTAKGVDSVPPWVGLAIALGAYVVYCLMTPKGKEFSQGLFNKGKKALSFSEQPSAPFHHFPQAINSPSINAGVVKAPT